MRPVAWWAPGVLLAVVVAAAYLVAVADQAVRTLVSGRRLDSAILTQPARTVSLIGLQRSTTTERPDAAAWMIAAPMLFAVAVVGLATVPLDARVAVADVPDGVVLYGAAMALVMVAVFVHGWAPNSVFPLLGAYRFAAQALSYQIPLFLVLLGTALPARSLSVGDVVASQHHLWNILRQPLGLPIYLAAGVGLSFWGPLALPDAPDLAGGTTAELSGHGLAAWHAARAALLVTTAAMAAATFLGGWQGPLLPGWAWMLLKSSAVILAFTVVGHLVPRPRPERFVLLAWIVLLPVALVDVFASGILALWTAP